MSTTSFKRCSNPSCPNTFPDTDGHSLCLACLGEGHLAQSCAVCLAFTAQTRKNGEVRLKAALYEKALLPPPPLGHAGPSPGPNLPFSLQDDPRAKKKAKKPKEKDAQDGGRSALPKKTAPKRAGTAAKTSAPPAISGRALPSLQRPLPATNTIAGSPVAAPSTIEGTGGLASPGPMPLLLPSETALPPALGGTPLMPATLSPGPNVISVPAGTQGSSNTIASPEQQAPPPQEGGTDTPPIQRAAAGAPPTQGPSVPAPREASPGMGAMPGSLALQTGSHEPAMPPPPPAPPSPEAQASLPITLPAERRVSTPSTSLSHEKQGEFLFIIIVLLLLYLLLLPPRVEDTAAARGSPAPLLAARGPSHRPMSRRRGAGNWAQQGNSSICRCPHS
ncbi:proline-rich protein HaeIII subfamily 1-like [Anolis sagrei]|uniref:proline-rich protein HaeIII subfamily 1-like n=1 Tax=Anolis sagrei TaxID=38937 RepID=UPI003521E8BD